MIKQLGKKIGYHNAVDNTASTNLINTTVEPSNPQKSGEKYSRGLGYDETQRRKSKKEGCCPIMWYHVY